MGTSDRSIHFEEQALVPMLGEHPIELGLKGVEHAFMKVLKTDSTYQRLFSAAFPGEDRVTLRDVTKAIAAFERSIVYAISLRSLPLGWRSVRHPGLGETT